jgi:hypothetical protein
MTQNTESPDTPGAFRPAHPVVEGQDPCPNEQAIAAPTQGRADQAQPEHARLVQLLQTRGLQTHHGLPRKLRVVEGHPLVDEAAPLEVDRRPPAAYRPHRPMAPTLGGRDRTVQHRQSTHHPIPVPRQQDPQPLDRGQPRLTTDTVESPLPRDRHGGFGERPGETDREQSRHRAPGRLNQICGVPARSHRHLTARCRTAGQTGGATRPLVDHWALFRPSAGSRTTSP